MDNPLQSLDQVRASALDMAVRFGPKLVVALIIIDHNTIAGALEIAHLPDAFVSEEITTFLPMSICLLPSIIMRTSPRTYRLCPSWPGPGLRSSSVALERAGTAIMAMPDAVSRDF